MLLFFRNGAAAGSHIALGVQRRNDDLVAAVVADIGLDGDFHGAISLVLSGGHCGRVHCAPGAAAGLGGFCRPGGYQELEQVVAALRYAEIVGACRLDRQLGNVQGVLDGLHLGLGDHFAGLIVQGELPSVAAGDPPEFHGARAGGSKADRIDHALVRVGLAAEIQTLGGGIAVVEGLAGAVDTYAYKAKLDLPAPELLRINV